jgi:predicted  nucleic acid-binding Zn-ribbon protein
MVEPYKPPHTHSPKNIDIHSTTSKLDHLENQYQRIQRSISGWDQNLDEKFEKLDEKLDKLVEKLAPRLARGTLGEPWNAQHI